MMLRVLVLTSLTMALGGCSVVAVLGENCIEDADCPADGVCHAGVCVLPCGGDEDCPPGDTCGDSGHCVGELVEPDAGPPPPTDGGVDAGPDAIDVLLTASPLTVTAGAAVTLTWTTTPAAEACALYVKTPLEDRAALLDAPAEGAGTLVVNPERDSEYTAECTLGDERGSGAVSVDVVATGTLSALPAEVNAGLPSVLSWTTSGASSCEVTGPDAYAYPVPAAELTAGSTTVSAPASGTYALTCDGAELASVPLSVASVRIVGVTPDALGLAPEQVTLVYEYEGPSALPCEVTRGGTTLADESAEPVAGASRHTLNETTTLEVKCVGYDGFVTDDVEVEQLISSFTGPASPVAYDTSSTLNWTTAAGVECTLNGTAETSPYAVTFRASAQYELVCTKGAASASETYTAAVRPRIDTVTGALVKPSSAGSEADVVLHARTTLNATGCVVNGGHLTNAAMDTPQTVDEQLVFELRVSAAAVSTTGGASYSVRCEASPGAETTVANSVRVWWGDLATADLSSFNGSQATMATGNLNLADSSVTSLSALGRLREVGGNVRLEEMTALQRLTGLEALEVVFGNVFIDENDQLRELSSGGDQGLVALREIRGGLSIEANDHAGFTAIALPALETIGQSLTIRNNGTLTTIAMSALSSIGTAADHGLTIEGNTLLFKSPLPSDGFPSLEEVSGSFNVSDSALTSLDGYFPSLQEIGGAKFEVNYNSNLPCADINAVYCGLDPRPGTWSVTNNADETCARTCP